MESTKSGIYKNIKYKAVIEFDRDILHILDTSGNAPFTSVTNGVDDLVPYLADYFKINDKKYFIICYGTDGILSRVNPYNFTFQHIEPDLVFIDHSLYVEMNNLYNVCKKR